MIYHLRNTIQDYDWGSTTHIPEYLGIANPDNKPQAEVWMGTHPRGESLAQTETGQIPLSKLIRQDPPRILGTACITRFGAKLPFLFKLLAAGRPLSLQAHPGKKQAGTGFSRENTAGIPVNAPFRNYRDGNHKPEIICALSEYWAMRGFRPLKEQIETLSAAITVPEADLFNRLGDTSREKSIKSLFTALYTLPKEEKNAIIKKTAAYAAKKTDDASFWVSKLYSMYPRDIGVLSPYLLQVIKLMPGEALYLDAGILHAYLQGFGVELMANSDNVLRGGLTSKYVDIEELQKVLTFEAANTRLVKTVKNGLETAYMTPSNEFELVHIHKEDTTPRLYEGNGSCMIFTAERGPVSVSRAGSDEITTIEKGGSVFAGADSFPLTIHSGCSLYGARVPV